MSDDPRRDAVTRVVEPVVIETGYDLEEVTLTRAGRRTVVRIAVDADDGITLDAVADVSRAVSDALDASTALGSEPYTLEVGSRGVSAPLVLERHWRRNRGRLVSVTFADRQRPKLTGRIVGVGAESATVAPEDAAASPHGDDTAGDVDVAYADVKRASVQVEFAKQRPGTAGADQTGPDDPTGLDDPTDEEEES